MSNNPATKNNIAKTYFNKSKSGYWIDDYDEFFIPKNSL